MADPYLARNSAGSNNVAKHPIIAITTSNSIKLKLLPMTLILFLRDWTVHTSAVQGARNERSR